MFFKKKAKPHEAPEQVKHLRREFYHMLRGLGMPAAKAKVEAWHMSWAKYVELHKDVHLWGDEYE